MKKYFIGVMPDSYLESKYYILDCDIKKGTYSDMLYQKQLELVAYRDAIIKRIDSKIDKCNELLSQNKSITKGLKSIIRFLSVIYGIDVPQRIERVYNLILNDKVSLEENKINATIDLVQCAVHNMCNVDIIGDSSVAQCIDMIDFASNHGVTYKSDRLYKNITFVNSIVKCKTSGKSDNKKVLNVIDKYNGYLKWENYHALDDNSYADYPTHQLSVQSLNFRDNILNREGM